MVREAGTEDYDISYVSETVQRLDGSFGPITLDQLHALVKEALGKSPSESITKLSSNNIVIRNDNGIRFLLKSPEPKLEVVFASTNLSPATPAPLAASMPQPALGPPGGAFPFGAPPMAASPDNWLTLIETNPSLVGHTSIMTNGQMLIFGGLFNNVSATNQCYLVKDFTRESAKFFQVWISGEAPPARHRHTSTQVGNRIFIFGGVDGGSYYNDMWILDIEKLAYQSVFVRGDIPQPRSGHTASLIGGKIYIFGGRVKMTSGYLSGGTWLQFTNDMYTYDIASSEWMQVKTEGIAPPARALHTATVIGKSIYIFGGATKGCGDEEGEDMSAFCDLYEFDTEKLTWRECETNGFPPTPCYGHTATLTATGNIFFFGGHGHHVMNDVHMFDTKIQEWKSVVYAGNVLDARWGHTANLLGTQVLLYGGKDENRCHATLKLIDIEKEVFETHLQEPGSENQLSKEKYLEDKQMREDIGNLQTSLEELRDVVIKITEELVNQKKAKDLLTLRLSRAQEESNELLLALKSLFVEKQTAIASATI